MCIVCAMTQTFDPGRHTGAPAFEDAAETGPLAANLSETSDAAGDSSTTYSMSAGDTFAGTIGTNTDTDWIQITFVEGNVYTIDAIGDGNGSTSGYDTDLRIFDVNGSELAYNDGAGAGYDAQLTYTATSSGTFFIEVSSYNSINSTGAYTLQVVEDVAPPPPPPPGTEGTVEQLAEYLKGGETGFERKFNTTTSNEITVNLNGLTAEGKQLARWAMEAWEMVADLEFVEVNSGEMITLDDEDSGAFAYFPNSGSTAAGVELNVSKSWLSSYGTSLDSYSFQTYIHEFGHALGLNHQGNYNYTGTPITYENYAYFSNDSWQMSVMSYFSQSENTSINASYALVMGAQAADITAIQDFYGAPGASGATAGNTTYGRGSNLGNYMDQVFDAWEAGTGSTTSFTIYDQGGTDTLDLGYYSASQALNIDLNGGTYSDLGSRIGVLGIATGTVIENLETGAGADTIMGNGADNLIQSGAGNDSVTAAAGNDTVKAGAGLDTIDGGAGADTLDGQGNADRLLGGAGNDILMGGDGADWLEGGADNDSLYGGEGADRLFGQDGNDLIRAGTNFGNSVDGVEGGAGDDTIFGEGGFDLLLGGTGNDEIHGGAQADNLYGEDGNDTLDGGDGFDRLFGGAGDDLLIDLSGTGGFFGGTGNDTMQGGADGSRYFAGSGDDNVDAGAGNDMISGNAGFDILDGGAGDDLIYGDFNADIFVFSGGHGNDTVGDFDALNALEKIDLSGVSGLSLADLQLGSTTSGAATQAGGDVVIDTGGGNSITLLGVSLGDLDNSDFIF